MGTFATVEHSFVLLNRVAGPIEGLTEKKIGAPEVKAMGTQIIGKFGWRGRRDGAFYPKMSR